MKSQPNLLSVGALTYDTIFQLDTLPVTPGKFLPSAAIQGAAGMASSAATGAKRHGADVSLWATVGQDPIGEILISEMQAEGIDCSRIRRVPGGRSAIAAILIDQHGERLIVPYYDPVTYAAPDQHAPAFERFDAILVDTRWPDAAAMALEAAKRHGIPGILDADVAPVAILQRLLPLASHVVASLPACHLLFGAQTKAAEATEHLHATTGVFVAVTDGSHGTFWREKDAPLQHIPSFEVKAVDTLAAGDIFHGVFAAALAEGEKPAQAIKLASAAAAIKCTRFGGRLGAPTRAETFAFLAEREKI